MRALVKNINKIHQVLLLKILVYLPSHNIQAMCLAKAATKKMNLNFKFFIAWMCQRSMGPVKLWGVSQS